MAKVLFAARQDRWKVWELPLRKAFDALDLRVDLVTAAKPETVHHIIYAPNSDVQDFTPYTNLKLVQNLWAGVEDVIGNATLKAPLCRMVDPGMTQGMSEWVTGHVMRRHLGLDTDILGQNGVWRKRVLPLAQDRTIGMIGLGVLGTSAARMLANIGFNVFGWSRSAKNIAGITCFHGVEGFQSVLRSADILVLLIPSASTSANILNAESLALLPKGAEIINPGRGTLIDDDALLAALESGQIRHATLDVFRVEPLPPDHPYWHHPNVTVTPHIASETRPETAAHVVAENIRRAEMKEPLLHLVDRMDK